MDSSDGAGARATYSIRQVSRHQHCRSCPVAVARLPPLVARQVLHIKLVLHWLFLSSRGHRQLGARRAIGAEPRAVQDAVCSSWGTGRTAPGAHGGTRVESISRQVSLPHGRQGSGRPWRVHSSPLPFASRPDVVMIATLGGSRGERLRKCRRLPLRTERVGSLADQCPGRLAVHGDRGESVELVTVEGEFRRRADL